MQGGKDVIIPELPKFSLGVMGVTHRTGTLARSHVRSVLGPLSSVHVDGAAPSSESRCKGVRM